MSLSAQMKWEGRDLGLRVFYRDEFGDWYAPYIGRASFDENTGEWLALIPGDPDEPVRYATARECKIAILATMVWKNKAYQERLHAELGDEGCPF